MAASAPPDDARIAPTIRQDPLLAELRAHPHRGPLGALALDVLGRQAEGRTQFVGREHVKRRAVDLGVDREASASSLCNLLDLLERGPETDRERRVVTSLAVLGLEDALRRDEGNAAALTERAVRHAVWLEIATDFAWLGALATETEGETQRRLGEAIAQAVLDSGVGATARRPRERARACSLVAALDAMGARGLLERLDAQSALDPVVASSVHALLGGASRRADVTLEGQAWPHVSHGAWTLVRWISGWALIVGAARLSLALLGRERRVGLALVGKELRIEESGGVLGVSMDERTSSVPASAVLAASRARRHGRAVLYAGAAALALGVLAGGWLLFDGLRSGELVLASVGAALLLGGVGADALAAWLAERPSDGAVVELVLPRGRVVRLLAPSVERADAFLEALRSRIS